MLREEWWKNAPNVKLNVRSDDWENSFLYRTKNFVDSRWRPLENSTFCGVRNWQTFTVRAPFKSNKSEGRSSMTEHNRNSNRWWLNDKKASIEHSLITKCARERKNERQMYIPNQIARLLLLLFEVKNRWSVSHSRKLTENLCTNKWTSADCCHRADTHKHMTPQMLCVCLCVAPGCKNKKIHPKLQHQHHLYGGETNYTSQTNNTYSFIRSLTNI